MDKQIVGMAETVATQPLDTSVAVLVDLLAVIVKEWLPVKIHHACTGPVWTQQLATSVTVAWDMQEQTVMKPPNAVIHHVSMGYVMIPQEDITAVVHLGIRGRTATVLSNAATTPV